MTQIHDLLLSEMTRLCQEHSVVEAFTNFRLYIVPQISLVHIYFDMGDGSCEA